jgi:hypothetical protein
MLALSHGSLLSPADPLREVLPNFPEHFSIHEQFLDKTSIITAGHREKKTKKDTNETCLTRGSRRIPLYEVDG